MREGWTYKKLGEVCTSITDGSHNPPKGIEHSEYRMISSQNIFDDEIRINDGNVRFLTEEDHYKENKRTKLSKDVVLLTIVGTIGRACVLKGTEGFITLQRSVAALQPSPKVYPRFLMHGLIGNRRKLEQEAHGIAQRGIYLRQLSELEIPIPPLSEQQSIVAELDKINELINLKKAQLSDLDNLAQSIFYDMFGDPIENEKGWEVKKLGEITEPTIGLTYKPDNVTSDGTGTIVLRSSNIQNSKLDFEDIVRVNVPIKDNKYVKDGDILMCSRNGSFRLVGKVAMIHALSEKMSYGAFMTIIRSEYNPYLFGYFKTTAFREYLIQGKTTTVNQITVQMLKEIKLPLPPLPLQQEFAKRIELIEQQKAQISSTIKDLETLLASRMQYWFD